MNLIDMLQLQQQGETVFRGGNMPLGGGRLFGGQLLGQGLLAAGMTCGCWRASSLHACFLNQGSQDAAVDYHVAPLKDGRSLAVRQVTIRQQEVILGQLNVSFFKAEDGLEYQQRMPVVAGPDNLADLSHGQGPDSGKQRTTMQMRVDIRPVPAFSTDKDRKYLWLQLIDDLPDAPLLRQAALAYCTDFGLFGRAREIHGFGFREQNLFTASLDHSIWFYRDFSITDWLLHSIECPVTAGSRGLTRGQLYRQDGQLIACVAQEGVLSLRS